MPAKLRGTFARAARSGDREPCVRKLILLLPPGPGAATACVARARQLVPGLERCVVNLADVETRAPAPYATPPYGAVVEAWTGSGALPAFPAGVHGYEVREQVQLEHALAPAADGRTPGVKAIYLVRRRDDLDDAEAKRRWRAHAPTAREHHKGMSRYVQNGVVQALTPASPLYHGIAILHFPTVSDLEERMYASERGREAVRRDVEGLVAESLPLYTSEYIVTVSP